MVVAFAAGSTSLDGTVLISGTGAVAARIEDGAQTQVADGLGWLLGDLGSGFWLGREAAALTARCLYACAGVATQPLVDAVAEAVGHRDPDRFVIAVQNRPAQELARLAPLVAQAAAAGDETALALADSAADHLARAASGGPSRWPDRSGRQRAASLHGSPRRVIKRLAAAFPAAHLSLAEPGEIGAARIAALRITNRR